MYDSEEGVWLTIYSWQTEMFLALIFLFYFSFLFFFSCFFVEISFLVRTTAKQCSLQKVVTKSSCSIFAMV